MARRVLNQDPSPERTARGLAAGFFAAAFPLPGLQIPLSILFAWVVRGNKAIAVLPQFLSNAGTMLPLAYAQFWIGARLWPGPSVDVAPRMHLVVEAAHAFSWLQPLRSLGSVLGAIGGLGSDVIGPMALGVVLSGMALGLLAYPLSLISLTYLQLFRLRRRAARGLGLRPARPLHLTSPAPSEIDPRHFIVHPQTLVTAEAVTLLVDGCQAYPEMLGAMARARHSVALETYILCDDLTGRRFAAELAAAAARGVKVRLLFDGVGALGLSYEYVAVLLNAGVRVRVYRPLSKFWRGFGPLNRRDHRKLLVVDEAVGFTGGLNIGDNYADRRDGGDGWRDTHMRIDGWQPAARMLSIFEEGWQSADEFTPLPARSEAPASSQARVPQAPLSPTSREVLVQVLSNKEFLQRVRMRRAYLHAIRHARRYILIENAYFIPDRGIRRALYRAVRRGVVVAVAVAMRSDVPLAAMASRALYSELLAGGVRIFEYPVSMLHSKTAVIDDAWSVIGSYNLDHRSLLHNLEVATLILDRAFAVALRKQILADIDSCQEVQRQVHDYRPWGRALAESLAYQFRYWL